MKIWKILLKTIILLIFVENIASAEYLKKKDQVFYIDEENLTKIMKNVDFTTFKVFDENRYFAKDKNGVYYKGEKIEKLNPENAKVFGSHFIKDDKVIFDADEKKELTDVDVNTLKSVGDYYFKDKSNAYFDMEKIEEKVDLDTFVYLDFFYAKDKNNLYFYGKKVKNIRPDNFTFLKMLSSVPDNIIKSGNDFYVVFENDLDNSINTAKINFSIDKDSFELYSMRVCKDKNNFYYYDEINDERKKLVAFKNEADMKTLEFLKGKKGEKSEKYIKDKNNIYFIDEENIVIKKIENADYNTFQVIEYSYAKDKNNVYYLGRKINQVNPNNFKIIEDSIRYNNEIYEIDENMNLIKIED